MIGVKLLEPSNVPGVQSSLGMGDFHPRCPKCDKPMARGHIPDIAHGQVLQSGWAPGEPVIRRFLGGIKYRADQVIPFSAYRCPACGYVEFYAREMG